MTSRRCRSDFGFWENVMNRINNKRLLNDPKETKMLCSAEGDTSLWVLSATLSFDPLLFKMLTIQFELNRPIKVQTEMVRESILLLPSSQRFSTASGRQLSLSRGPRCSLKCSSAGAAVPFSSTQCSSHAAVLQESQLIQQLKLSFTANQRIFIQNSCSRKIPPPEGQLSQSPMLFFLTQP